MAQEVAKRLMPTKETIRELFGKSGNRCYFPTCNHVLLSDDGKFVSQIIHIEAAEPGGPRFNKNMSNEDRRAFANLMLMCYRHHVETDDATAYSVKILKEMKQRHEEKFLEKIDNFVSRFHDNSKLVEPKYCNSLDRFVKSGVFDFTDEKEKQDMITSFSVLADRLKRLPIQERDLLAIALDRATPKNGGREVEFHLYVLAEEVSSAIGINWHALNSKIEVLEKHGFASYDVDDNVTSICIHRKTGSWHHLALIKYFCEDEKIDIKSIVSDLDFSVLDA